MNANTETIIDGRLNIRMPALGNNVAPYGPKVWNWLREIIGPLSGPGRSFAHHRKQRLNENALARLNDTVLKDIGLSRGDLLGLTEPSPRRRTKRRKSIGREKQPGQTS